MPSRAWLPIGLIAAVLCAAPAAVAWQEAKPAPEEVQEKELSPRERWERLSPEEREVMRKRFEEFQRLGEDERRQLRDRTKRMHSMERDVRERLPRDVRRKLEGLPPKERDELMKELVEQEATDRGRRMRDKLPREVREQLESASPEERDRLLRDFRERHREEWSKRALRRYGERFELPEDEVRRLQALPREERKQAVLGFRRREMSERFAADGLPDWLTPDQWKELSALDDRAFFERFDELEPERGGPLGELRKLMRPDPAWMLEMSELSPGERRKAMGRRLRERVLGHLEANPDLLPAAEVERLKELEGREFMEALWKRCGKDRFDGRRGGRRGPPDGDRRGDSRGKRGHGDPGKRGGDDRCEDERRP